MEVGYVRIEDYSSAFGISHELIEDKVKAGELESIEENGILYIKGSAVINSYKQNPESSIEMPLLTKIFILLSVVTVICGGYVFSQLWPGVNYIQSEDVVSLSLVCFATITEAGIFAGIGLGIMYLRHIAHNTNS